MSLDKYMDRTFNAKTYNCWDFVREVWKDLYGVDLRDRIALASDIAVTRDNAVEAVKVSEGAFTRLDKPVDPCLVFMERANIIPHVGIYIRKRILSINDKGVSFVPVHLATLGFNKVGYYL